MRATMLAVLFLFTTGAAMSTAMADEPKKEEKPLPDPEKPGSYNEKVTIRFFERGIRPNGGLVTSLTKPIPAFRYEKDGVLKIYTHATEAGFAAPKSEITDEAGKVYIVTGSINLQRRGWNIYTVEPKPVEKKP